MSLVDAVRCLTPIYAHSSLLELRVRELSACLDLWIHIAPLVQLAGGVEGPVRVKGQALQQDLADKLGYPVVAWQHAAIVGVEQGSDDQRDPSRGGLVYERWRTVLDWHRWRLAGGFVRLLARLLGALLAVSGALSALLVNETSRLRRDREEAVF